VAERHDYDNEKPKMINERQKVDQRVRCQLTLPHEKPDCHTPGSGDRWRHFMGQPDHGALWTIL